MGHGARHRQTGREATSARVTSITRRDPLYPSTLAGVVAASPLVYFGACRVETKSQSSLPSFCFA